MSEPESPVTVLLIRWRDGDQDALNELTPLIYDNLRRIAARHLSRERVGFSMCATEIVHEAYQRLMGVNVDWQDRAHFLAIASRQMRQFLVDYARTKGREKRGGGDWQRVTLTERGEVVDGEQVDILAVEQVLERLAEFDERKAQIVDLIVFGGLKGHEVAELLSIPEHTLWREWRLAKAWLNHELKAGQ